MESLSQPLAPVREGCTATAVASTAHTCFSVATFSQSSDPSLSGSSWSHCLWLFQFFHGKKEEEFWSRICQCLPSSPYWESQGKHTRRTAIYKDPAYPWDFYAWLYVGLKRLRVCWNSRCLRIKISELWHVPLLTDSAVM